MTTLTKPGSDIRILPECPAPYREILSPDALAFVAMLHERFAPQIEARLAARAKRHPEKIMSEVPTTRSPSASAASTMRLATRSLTDPPGFWPSNLAQMATSGDGDSGASETRGVPPMRSRTLS